MARHISPAGLSRLKRFEGVRTRAYNDAAGYATVGYGHLIHYGRVGTNPEAERGLLDITLKEADALLVVDLRKFEAVVEARVTTHLCGHMFDALVCFAFNVGTNAFANSTLLRKLNAHDYRGASEQFTRWVRAGGRVVDGLVARRHMECAMFLDELEA